MRRDLKRAEFKRRSAHLLVKPLGMLLIGGLEYIFSYFKNKRFNLAVKITYSRIC